MTDLFAKLKAEFPRTSISWRAQTVTKDGKSAMALAYIDARDVMNRLDDACGPENWTDRYMITEGRTICTIGIRIVRELQNIDSPEDYDWITKSDGAGETQVEGDKGAMSDAFKRAAVKWGIGRYLYDMPAPWVPCESKEWQGKMQFRKFTADPWAYIKSDGPPMGPLTKTALEKKLRAFHGSLSTVNSSAELAAIQVEYEAELKQCREYHPKWWDNDNEEAKGLSQRILEKQEYFDMNRQTALDAG